MIFQGGGGPDPLSPPLDPSITCLTRESHKWENTISVNLDETPHNVASDQGPHRLAVVSRMK